jgi:hypothetical protein
MNRFGNSRLQMGARKGDRLASLVKSTLRQQPVMRGHGRNRATDSLCAIKACCATPTKAKLFGHYGDLVVVTDKSGMLQWSHRNGRIMGNGFLLKVRDNLGLALSGCNISPFLGRNGVQLPLAEGGPNPSD